MSIAGGLFSSDKKDEKGGDSRTTADGDAGTTPEQPVDLTTALPGFDDDSDEGLVIDTASVRGVEADWPGPGNVDVEGVTGTAQPGDFDFDVDAVGDVRLDPES